jgi:hypothetical protein
LLFLDDLLALANPVAEQSRRCIWVGSNERRQILLEFGSRSSELDRRIVSIISFIGYRGFIVCQAREVQVDSIIEWDIESAFKGCIRSGRN